MTEDVDAMLARIKAERTDTMGQLHELRSRLRGLRADFAEQVRNDRDPLSPRIVEALVEATREGAPVEYRRIGERVEAGQFTWTELYADPESVAGPEGRALVRTALHGGRLYEREMPDAPDSPGEAEPGPRPDPAAPREDRR